MSGVVLLEICEVGMIEKPTWTWRDGWILMSIYMADGEHGAELSSIIGCADASNHAIPTVDELSSAMTKFVQCGYVEVVNQRCRIAEHFFPFVEKAWQGRGGLFMSADKGLRLLKRTKPIAVSDTQIEFSEAEVNAAYKAYVKMLKRK